MANSADSQMCWLYFLQPAFREDVRREGMVEAIVNHLRRGDVPLKTLCATALFKVGTV